MIPRFEGAGPLRFFFVLLANLASLAISRSFGAKSRRFSLMAGSKGSKGPREPPRQLGGGLQRAQELACGLLEAPKTWRL